MDAGHRAPVVNHALGLKITQHPPASHLKPLMVYLQHLHPLHPCVNCNPFIFSNTCIYSGARIPLTHSHSTWGGGLGRGSNNWAVSHCGTAVNFFSFLEVGGLGFQLFLSLTVARRWQFSEGGGWMQAVGKGIQRLNDLVFFIALLLSLRKCHNFQHDGKDEKQKNTNDLKKFKHPRKAKFTPA